MTPDRGGVPRAMLGIALTGAAVGLCWLSVAIVLGVGIGRAIKRAEDEADRRAGVPAEPQIEVEADGGPLLGVVLPRASSFQS